MDAEHYRLRDFLTRTAQPYEWHARQAPAEADLLLANLGLADAASPVLVDGDRTFTSATVESIALAWGGLQPPKQAHYDFAVIGAGPARPRGRRLCRLRRSVDDRVRPGCARRPGLVHGHDRELLRLSRTGSVAPSWRVWPVGRQSVLAPS